MLIKLRDEASLQENENKKKKNKNTPKKKNAEKLNKEQDLRLLLMKWREKEDMWELW